MSEKKQWKVVEIMTKGTAGVVISKMDLEVPRFSFRVGTAKFMEEGGSPHVTPWLNTYNALDGAELVAVAEEKYGRIREAKLRQVKKRQEEREQEGPLITHKGD